MALEPQIGEFEETKHPSKTVEQVVNFLDRYDSSDYVTTERVAGYLTAKFGSGDWADIIHWNTHRPKFDFDGFVGWFNGKEQVDCVADIQVELQIDPELRSDLGGLAKYVVKEIEQDTQQLRKWAIENTDIELSLETRITCAEEMVRYVTTGQHQWMKCCNTKHCRHE